MTVSTGGIDVLEKSVICSICCVYCGSVGSGGSIRRRDGGLPGIDNCSSFPTSIQRAIPASNTNPNQTITLDTTNIETAITQSVKKVGPAVVTVVGTIPGQMTFFGQMGDQTVSGTGFFITDQWATS